MNYSSLLFDVKSWTVRNRQISDRPPQHDLQISELNHSWTHVYSSYMDLTELIITRSHEPNTCWPTLSVLKVYLECDMFTVHSSMWHRVNGSYSHVVTTPNWTRGNKNRLNESKLTCFYNFCKYIVTFNPQKNQSIDQQIKYAVI